MCVWESVRGGRGGGGCGDVGCRDGPDPNLSSRRVVIPVRPY